MCILFCTVSLLFSLLWEQRKPEIVQFLLRKIRVIGMQKPEKMFDVPQLRIQLLF